MMTFFPGILVNLRGEVGGRGEWGEKKERILLPPHHQRIEVVKCSNAYYICLLHVPYVALLSLCVCLIKDFLLDDGYTKSRD